MNILRHIAISSLCLLSCISISAQKDSVVTYFFLLDDCMICQYYSPTFLKLKRDFPEMTFIGIFPNFRSKKDKIDSYKKEFDFPFETKTDYFKTLTQKFNVHITPEVVVYNTTQDEIIYKGRIDNAYVGLGKRRRVITDHNLIDVLANVDQGNYNPVAYTEAVGCFIEKSTPLKN